MKTIHIDFSRRTFRRALAHTGVLTWLLGAIGLALCILLGMRAWALHQQSRAQEAELHRVQAQLAQRNARRPAVKKWTVPADQANAVNQAIVQLNLPWRDLLDTVEAATPSSIALLSLEPDAKKRQLRVLAEAKTSDAMIAYVEQLKRQSFFQEVVLVKHEINEQDPNKPIRFQFETQWTGEIQ